MSAEQAALPFTEERRIPICEGCRWHRAAVRVGPPDEGRDLCLGCYYAFSPPRHWPKKRRPRRRRGADGRLRPVPRPPRWRCRQCGIDEDVLREAGFEHRCDHRATLD